MVLDKLLLWRRVLCTASQPTLFHELYLILKIENPLACKQPEILLKIVESR
jgi:hypothetical protein